MKKTTLLLGLVCTLIAQLCLEQTHAQVIRNQADIGGTSTDILITTCRTADNGFLAVGYSNSGISTWKSESSNGLFAIWVVKFEPGQTGQDLIQWEKTITRPGQNIYVTEAISCTDGGFLISSRISNVSANDDAWLVKLDPAGNIQWNKIFSTPFSDEIVSLSETSDKGFILGASFGFVKIDSTGTTEWQNQPSDFYINGAYLNSVFQSQHAGPNAYIAGGGVTRVEGDSVVIGEILARTDNRCNPLQEIVYPPADSMNVIFYLLMRATPTNDGALLHGLIKEDGASSYYTADIVKADNRGNFKWRYINRRLFDQNETHPIAAIPTMDGGYIYGGTVLTSEILPPDYFVEKLDHNGLLVWSKTIKGNQGDRLSDIKEIKKGFYLVAGTSESNIGMDKTKRNLGESDYWFLTIEDTTTADLSVANNIAANRINNNRPLFTLSPNPAKNVLHMQSEGQHTIMLINQNGREVLRTIINGSQDINISDLPAGLYYVKDNVTGFTQKLVIAK